MLWKWETCRTWISYQYLSVPVCLWWHVQLNLYGAPRGGNPANSPLWPSYPPDEPAIGRAGWSGGRGGSLLCLHPPSPFSRPLKVISLVVNFVQPVIVWYPHDSAQLVPRVPHLQWDRLFAWTMREREGRGRERKRERERERERKRGGSREVRERAGEMDDKFRDR